MAEVITSAPGKVLMTGGYLILDRPNAGLVLSTNARFYTIVKPIRSEPDPENWAWAWANVKLTSPQLARESLFKLSLRNFNLQGASSCEARNPFVEQAVQHAVTAAFAKSDESKKDKLRSLLLQGLDITILGSNDFYSYRNQIQARGLPLTAESLASLPPFTSITFNESESTEQNSNESESTEEISNPEVAKTGLGSSAAMTTAVVAALLHYLGVVNLSSLSQNQLAEMDTTDLDMVHVIAQAAHCVAQGKVGSGFDVSSAVYGSHRYVRFSPDVIYSAQDASSAMSAEEAILDIIEGNWDHERTKFSLPPLMNLLLGEPGTGGSSTPSMVGAVRKWKKSDPEKSLDTWRKLAEANSTLEARLNMLSKFAKERWDVYKSVVDSCSLIKPEKWIELATDSNQTAVVTALLEARDAMLGIRFLMRQMGEAAGVPIEPKSQTQLLDATMNVEGVLLAGVPGAGGFDAVFAVTLGSSGKKVADLWSSLNVLPMLVREDPRGVSLESSDPRSIEITSGLSTLQIA